MIMTDSEMINASEAYSITLNSATFNKFLNKVFIFIKESAKVGRFECYVPISYDRKLDKIIIEILKEKGFSAEIYNNKYIHINWEKGFDKIGNI